MLTGGHRGLFGCWCMGRGFRANVARGHRMHRGHMGRRVREHKGLKGIMKYATRQISGHKICCWLLTKAFLEFLSQLTTTKLIMLIVWYSLMFYFHRLILHISHYCSTQSLGHLCPTLLTHGVWHIRHFWHMVSLSLLGRLVLVNHQIRQLFHSIAR